jgi:hypothetical protein
VAANAADVVDPNWKALYRVGGVSAALYGIVIFIGTALLIAMGPLPNGGEALLEYFAKQTTLAWTAVGFLMLSDFLFLPFVLSLYQALKGVHRSAMLVATGFVGLFIALDLGVTLSNFSSLITLGANYAAATSDAQRAAYIAGAYYVSSVLATSLPIYSTILGFLGTLLISLVMLKGIFTRAVASLGVVSSVVGIVSGIPLPPLNLAFVVAFPLLAIWSMLVGYRLYKLGQR